MGHPQEQFACAAQVHQRGGFLLARQIEVQLGTDLIQPAGPVFPHGLLELLITRGRIVEMRDGLRQRVGGKVRQLILKHAEGHAALLQIVHAFGLVQAQAVGYKFV